MEKEEKVTPITVKDGLFRYSDKEAKAAGIETGIAKLNREARFSKVMRDLRNRKGMTQQQVADRLGITKSTVGLYETGDNLPDIKTLYKIAELFQVSADYIIGRSDVESPDITIQAICEKTGLSAPAIKKLMEVDKNGSIIKTINYLIETGNAIGYIDNYLMWGLYSRTTEELTEDGEPLLPMNFVNKISGAILFDLLTKEDAQKIFLIRIQEELERLRENIKE